MTQILVSLSPGSPPLFRCCFLSQLVLFGGFHWAAWGRDVSVPLRWHFQRIDPPPSLPGLFCFSQLQGHLQVLRVPLPRLSRSRSHLRLFQARCCQACRTGSPEPRPAGEAWISPCPVHASQNRKGQSAVGIVGWNVKSGPLDSKVLILWVNISYQTTPRKTQFPLSFRCSYTEPRFPTSLGRSYGVLWGQSRWETPALGDEALSAPVLRNCNGFFICEF